MTKLWFDVTTHIENFYFSQFSTILPVHREILVIAEIPQRYAANTERTRGSRKGKQVYIVIWDIKYSCTSLRYVKWSLYYYFLKIIHNISKLIYVLKSKSRLSLKYLKSESNAICILFFTTYSSLNNIQGDKMIICEFETHCDVFKMCNFLFVARHDPLTRHWLPCLSPINLGIKPFNS